MILAVARHPPKYLRASNQRSSDSQIWAQLWTQAPDEISLARLVYFEANFFFVIIGVVLCS